MSLRTISPLSRAPWHLILNGLILGNAKIFPKVRFNNSFQKAGLNPHGPSEKAHPLKPDFHLTVIKVAKKAEHIHV